MIREDYTTKGIVKNGFQLAVLTIVILGIMIAIQDEKLMLYGLMLKYMWPAVLVLCIVISLKRKTVAQYIINSLTTFGVIMGTLFMIFG